ncbi:MAG: ammonium transporter [Gammaproteobacteria bacterium]|nr:ammonium transporter [Gammaproteobacteria bacterium]
MDASDTAWILISIALVLLMTPGLAFFYGGLVRDKQVLNTIKMSFVALGVISVEWALIGYSLAFAPGSAWLGGLGWLGLAGVDAQPQPLYSDTLPHLLFMAFQMMFAVITPALISGAVVGRMKFKAYLLFILFWGLVIYNPIAHWVWGPGGWIGEIGALDFAGGTVVHISAGVSALVAAIVLGPRKQLSNSSNRPHNVPFVVLGASLLWFGWFGFNAGSALAADGIAALACVTTMLGAASAVVTWIILEMLQAGKTSASGAAIAAVVGLVAITPAAGFVTPLAALAIGAAGSTASYLTIKAIKRTGLDDTLDVFACHGIAGIVGSLLTGVFATTSVNPGGADGLLYGNAYLLVPQLISVVAAGLYAAVGTGIILLILDKVVGLRADETAETDGIDLVEHAENAYSNTLM